MKLTETDDLKMREALYYTLLARIFEKVPNEILRQAIATLDLEKLEGLDGKPKTAGESLAWVLEKLNVNPALWKGKFG